MSDSLEMPNWSRVIHGRVHEGAERVSLLMEEIAEKANSEIACMLCPDRTRTGIWSVPSGWVYAEREVPAEISLPEEEEFVRQVLKQERVVLDAGLGDAIPQPFERMGVHSLIATAIGREKREGMLVVCNSKNVAGTSRFQLHYQRADVDLAMVMARVISLDGVGDLLREGRMEPQRKQNDLWTTEKPELLRTHPGWYVAYQEGTRIALERSLAELVAAINKKLGVPHKPCEFHEIVEKPAARRGPSPRLKSAH